MLGMGTKVRTSGPSRTKRFLRWHGESPFTFWLYFGFVALLAAGIVLVLLPGSWFHGDDGDGRPPVTAAVPLEVYPAKCAEQAPVKMSTRTPLVPDWTVIGTTPTPFSGKGGPLLTDTPRQCFARSFEGAVYSAATFTAEMAAETDNSARRQITLDRYSHQGRFEQLLEQADKPFTPSSLHYEFVGYRVVNATPDVVQVDLAIRAVNGPDAMAIYAVSHTLVWERNDWLIMPSTSAKGFTVQSLSDFTGFTPWGQAG